MSTPEFPSPDVARFLARADEALASLSALNERFDERARAEEARDAEHDEERAQAARSGTYGAAWQRVQLRIDRGETTLSDVMSGEDSSADAAALRATARTNLSEIAQLWRESDEQATESAGEPESPAALVSRAAIESRAAFEEALAEVRLALATRESTTPRPTDPGAHS